MKSLSRRNFIKKSGIMATTIALPLGFKPFLKENKMSNIKQFEVIIIGGSYSGLAAAMALGRALRKVLIIDSGKPCNSQTPHSHNFLTQDGKTPSEIVTLAKQQVLKYETISFFNGLVTDAIKTKNGFEIQTSLGEKFAALKLIFATGIKDEIPNIKGVSECWGISILHCPYCHGYEVKLQPTGILGNGDYGFEFSKLISNWTNDLMLFTNGKSTLTSEQTIVLKKYQIKIVEKEIEQFIHSNGQLQEIIFKDGSRKSLKAIYTRLPFKQHCLVPEYLGCEFTEEGYIKIDSSNKTTINGVYACGDNTTRMRTVANAISMGTSTGIMVNKEFVEEKFITK